MIVGSSQWFVVGYIASDGFNDVNDVNEWI